MPIGVAWDLLACTQSVSIRLRICRGTRQASPDSSLYPDRREHVVGFDGLSSGFHDRGVPSLLLR